MIPLALCLSLASYATAQLSMIPAPTGTMAPGYVASSDSSYAYSGAPPAVTSSTYGSSSPSYNQNSPPPSYNQYSSAPPAQYTPPPQTEAMPYSSFMSGGYKSMYCGYGYQKGSDGSCTSTQSWVRIYISFSFCIPLTRYQWSSSGCYQPPQS